MSFIVKDRMAFSCLRRCVWVEVIEITSTTLHLKCLKTEIYRLQGVSFPNKLNVSGVVLLSFDHMRCCGFNDFGIAKVQDANAS